MEIFKKVNLMTPEQLARIAFLRKSIKKLTQEKQLHEMVLDNTRKLSRKLNETDSENHSLIPYHEDLRTDISSFKDRIDYLKIKIQESQQEIQEITGPVVHSCLECSLNLFEIPLYLLVVFALLFLFRKFLKRF